VTPYYDEAGITIYHGDCREILPSLGTFDLVLTDSPWGVGLDTRNRARGRGVGRRRRSRSHDHAPIHGDDKPFDPAHLLQVSPRTILWGANHFADRLPASPMWLVWDRVSGTSDVTDAELAWVKGHRFKTVRLFQHQWAGVLRASENARRVLHPTQKPVALMRWCLGFFPEARTVVDPYMGSGPVARACKDAGLRYVGIDIVESYCEISAERCAQEVLLA
jgi:DNA modification methylase